jgi:hypothetical protein
MKKVKTSNIKVIIGIMITLILCSSNVFAYTRNVVFDKKNEQNIDERKAKVKREEARKIAKETLSKYFNYTIDDNFNESIELREGYTANTYIWDISWDKEIENKQYDFYIEVNAENGKIQSINKNVYNRNDQESEISTMSKKDAKKKSDEF